MRRRQKGGAGNKNNQVQPQGNTSVNDSNEGSSLLSISQKQASGSTLEIHSQKSDRQVVQKNPGGQGQKSDRGGARSNRSVYNGKAPVAQIGTQKVIPKPSETYFTSPSKESKYLQQLLVKKFKLEESPVSAEKRSVAMSYLTMKCNVWAQQQSQQQQQTFSQDQLFQLVLFGSYRLGVHFPSTDIDAICAFKAGNVTRQMFFDQFVQMIEKDPRFSLVCSVNQAQVPIIKCVIDGVQFDLLYASVEKPNELIAKLHESNPSQQDWFRKLSEHNQNSLFGRIANDNILRCVSMNEATFKLALRCVRFWAVRRGLYSVNAGYFSGITLSVMVAKLCQEFPDLHASCIVYKFFDRYANSDWREHVQLNLMKGNQGHKNLTSSNITALNRISNDLMVVLVPIDQIKNTSYKVSQYTFDTICTELRRALGIIKQIAPHSAIREKPPRKASISLANESLDDLIDIMQHEGATTPSPTEEQKEQDLAKVPWKNLFQGIRFFQRFEHFIKVDILSQDAKENFKWSSYIETQLKRLTDMLGQEIKDQLIELRINPRLFTTQDTKEETLNLKFEHCSTYFIGLKFKYPHLQSQDSAQVINLRPAIEQFSILVDAHRIDKQTNDVRLMYHRQCQLNENLLNNF